jgi:hypothetical protein
MRPGSLTGVGVVTTVTDRWHLLYTCSAPPASPLSLRVRSNWDMRPREGVSIAVNTWPARPQAISTPTPRPGHLPTHSFASISGHCRQIVGMPWPRIAFFFFFFFFLTTTKPAWKDRLYLPETQNLKSQAEKPPLMKPNS